MAAGIWIPQRDENGLIKSFGILVSECANEPPHRKPRPDDTIHTRPKLTHGAADEIWDEGATLLCRACSARERRLRALPSWARAWVEAQGLDDWPPRPVTAPSALAADGGGS
jgi:hypothetical protein